MAFLTYQAALAILQTCFLLRPWFSMSVVDLRPVCAQYVPLALLPPMGHFMFGCLLERLL